MKVAGLDPSAYRVTYDGSYWVGTAKATFEAQGNGYKGVVAKDYTIILKGATVSGVKVARKRMTVKAKTAKRIK